MNHHICSMLSAYLTRNNAILIRFAVVVLAVRIADTVVVRIFQFAVCSFDGVLTVHCDDFGTTIDLAERGKWIGGHRSYWLNNMVAIAVATVQ